MSIYEMMDVFLNGGNPFSLPVYIKSPHSTLSILHNFECQLYLSKAKKKKFFFCELKIPREFDVGTVPGWEVLKHVLRYVCLPANKGSEFVDGRNLLESHLVPIVQHGTCLQGHSVCVLTDELQR